MVTMHALMESLEPRMQLSVTLPRGFTETAVATNIGAPTAVDVLPDSRILVSNQTGDLDMIQNNALLPTPFLHLDVDSNGERGLLGVTHDPNFAVNHFIYVYHTVPATGSSPAYNQVSRFTANGNVAASSSEVDILNLNPLSHATNHNGGSLHFGLDGMLYIGVGENATPANSQTIGNLLGKMLRIDVSLTQPGDPINDVAKLVPLDNPFVRVARGINQAIYALGFRNPFTFAIEPGSGTIFVDDVGEQGWEEIDKLQAGGNYGWRYTEGFARRGQVAGMRYGHYVDPLMAYPHTGGPSGPGTAIIGGLFYDPPRRVAHPFPVAYVDKFFYGDLFDGWIRTFNRRRRGSLANPDTSSPFSTGQASGLTAMALAPDGGIYYLTQGNGGELDEISYVPRGPRTART